MGVKQNQFLAKSKEIICMVFMAIFVLAFILYQRETISNRTFNNLDAVALANKFLIIALIATAAMFALYFFVIKKGVKLHNFYLVTMITMGLAYMVIFLPYTVPDEILHYFSAYRVSNYFLFNVDQFGNDVLFIRQGDLDFFNSSIHLQSTDYYYKIKGCIELFCDQRNIVEYSSQYVDYVTNVPFGYIISGLGIAVARLFRLSPLFTFYFGRIFNITAYSLMTWYAMKKIPYGKMAIFAISLIPMSTHLTASYSYDSQIVAYAMLFVSQVLYMREKEGFISLKDIVLCAIFSIILAPSKMVYMPLILLVFIIPKEKFNISPKKVWLVKTAVCLIGILTLMLFQLGNISDSVGDGALSYTDAEAPTVMWVLQHPLKTIKVLVNTLFVKGDFYADSLAGFSLGWFQINVPGYIYEPFYLFLAYSFMMRKSEKFNLKFVEKLWAFVLVAGSAMCLLGTMFLAWTPITSAVVEGVQGRYFMPLILTLAIVVKNKYIVVDDKLDKYFVFLLIYWSFISGMQYFVSSFI